MAQPDVPAPLSRDVFLAGIVGVVACIPFAMWSRGNPDLALRLQFGFVVTVFCAATIYRERTRVYGNRAGERPPIIIGHPRKAGSDPTRLMRIVAALVIFACALYFLAAIAWVAS